MHSSCLPITVSRSDPFYAPQNIKCLAFIRSNIISNNPYKIDVGEQVNGVTSYLDLSQIYASDFEQMKKVRSFNGGRLKVDIKNILPMENGKYFSGDHRAMQTPFLAIIHSLFVRNHNNIADKLGALNRHWSEERLFQEARKINVAIYQKIIYEEWLELFVGSENADQLKLTEYDINADATTLNEFSTAAFRIFHAFLPSMLEIRNENTTEMSLNLSDLLKKSELLNYYENILRGMTHQKMNLVGYSNEVLNRMFKNQNKIGIDLLSMDIMRGRDHGIPAYHKFLKMCNVTANNIKVFNDLAPMISKKSIIQLRQTYKTVYDIDLIVGGALENLELSSKGGVFGPTFECIIREQFNRWKSGDFYFYSHKSSFTGDQLRAIRSYKLANFLCENSNLNEIKSEAFLNDSTSVKCSNLEIFDFSQWKEDYENEDEDD
jgi:peroxidase